MTSIVSTLLLTSALEGSESAEQLIRQLGHPEFQRRVAAQRELLSKGSDCLPALGSAAESADPEIRHRSRVLLEQFQRAAFLDQQAEILKDPWRTPVQITPHWDFYQSLAGDGPAARELYVGMLRQETDLMLRSIRDPSNWSAAFEQRCGDLRGYSDRRANGLPEPASVAALLLLGLHPGNKPSPTAVDTIDKLLVDGRFENSTRKLSVREPLRGLINRWIELNLGSPVSVRMTLARQYQLPGGVVPAREVLAARQASQSPQHVREAIGLLAADGGMCALMELAALVEPEDPQLSPVGIGPAVAPPGRRPDIQVGDLALYQLVRLTGQNPADYGFTETRRLLQGTSVTEGNFPTPETRKTATWQWKSWRAQHLPSRVTADLDASEGFPL